MKINHKKPRLAGIRVKPNRNPARRRAYTAINHRAESAASAAQFAYAGTRHLPDFGRDNGTLVGNRIKRTGKWPWS
jgi:hypothetical protein